MRDANNTNMDESLDAALDGIREVINGEAPDIDILELTEKVGDIPTGSTQTKVHGPISGKEPANVNSNLIDTQVVNESRQALREFARLMGKPGANPLSLKLDKALEDILIDLLKPRLSAWLNHNLPNIVTGVVQKEIQKLIPQDE